MNPLAFSALFEESQRGNWSARDAVYRIAFARLRSIASSLLRHERREHTLQATALVGELFLKLQRLQLRVLDEDHFFRISARAMRQVLIDHSRTRAKGRKVAPESVPELLLVSAAGETDLESLLAVRSVFDKLENLDPKAANTVWLRSVEGLTLAEVAKAQGREIWRVRADYDFGVKWMAGRMKHQVPSSRELTSRDQASTSGGRFCGFES